MPVNVIHDGIGTLKSSQAFAVNVFAGLHSIGLLGESVARAFGTGTLENVSLEFEFWDDDFKRFLGESDHQTQVDVLIRAMDGATQRVFLIEVKLTEPYFALRARKDRARTAREARRRVGRRPCATRWCPSRSALRRTLCVP